MVILMYISSVICREEVERKEKERRANTHGIKIICILKKGRTELSLHCVAYINYKII